jgi:hypothetical protein
MSEETRGLDDKIKAIEHRKKGNENPPLNQNVTGKTTSSKIKNWKTPLFVLYVLILLFGNVSLQVIEHKTGMRLSRALTFILPLIIGYVAFFKLWK